MRAFVAIDPGATVRESYALFYERAVDAYPGLRWVVPDNLHITLRFLGDVDESDATALQDTVRSVTCAHSPFEIEIGRPLGFGSKAVPRTLVFELQSTQRRLESLAASIERAVRDCGHAPERRRFCGHLTVARNPRSRRLEGWHEFLQSSALPGLCFRVESLTLYSSSLRPQGPEYTAVWSQSLAAPW